ncbi:hypothetical protein M9H77_18634 [Catharanthus roseus]|uniref:Uncharacterized protein n=1 Tax=Catharanthus roseus TaxID=4058 RepID=A0ACC0B7Z8_CATRO|nr:hypothetical protein M9H77_18634 [Catharanthus roseus]
MAFLFTNTYEKPHSDQGVNSADDLVFGSIRGLHCTWLVSHTSTSSNGLIWYFVGTDYKMPELCSDDLVRGSGLCPWSPTFVLHVLLNLGVEAALMCLDSLRLSSCARNPHVGSSISFVEIIKENVFL